MGTLSSTYHDGLIGHASASFDNLLQIKERIKGSLKTGKFKDYQMLFEQLSRGVKKSTKKTFTHKKSKNNGNEVHSISGPASQHQQSYAHPIPTYHISAPNPYTPSLP